MRKTRRRLPHWQQEGATYFLTFRTADSMPKEVMNDWLRRRAAWLEMKGVRVAKDEAPDLSGLGFELKREYDRVFLRALQTELDRGHGACFLRKPEHADVVRQALSFFDGERYALGDFVIMPNHVHVLVLPSDGHGIGEILKSWKSYSARFIHSAEGRDGAFWQRESWDHIVRNRKQLDSYREYIAENPRMAGLREGEFIHQRMDWAEEER